MGFSIVLIGLSLSMDAFAVSVSSGISVQGLRRFHIGRASCCFGLFQFLMPVTGWLLGKTFAVYIEAYDHWIALGLLSFLGVKMLKEAFFSKPVRTAQAADRVQEGTDIRNLGTLLILALATSIDALAVGISFSVLNQAIWGPAAIIGGITLGVCLLGFEFGRRIGMVFKQGAQVAGGLILIGLGCNILIEHLWRF
ncbi:MAG: manganese efflux pump MntP family protein [Treponema sp.]|jgi:putative Mn2+ efflux pump MntP|nr:manganese efflux pump MntP family protein [Treponema sp.]